jgi:hypothetical protein
MSALEFRVLKVKGLLQARCGISVSKGSARRYSYRKILWRSACANSRERARLRSAVDPPIWECSGNDLAAQTIGLIDPDSGLSDRVLELLLAIEIFGPKPRTAAGVADSVAGMRCSSVTGCAFCLRK